MRAVELRGRVGERIEVLLAGAQIGIDDLRSRGGRVLDDHIIHILRKGQGQAHGYILTAAAQLGPAHRLANLLGAVLPAKVITAAEENTTLHRLGRFGGLAYFQVSPVVQAAFALAAPDAQRIGAVGEQIRKRRQTGDRVDCRSGGS